MRAGIRFEKSIAVSACPEGKRGENCHRNQDRAPAFVGISIYFRHLALRLCGSEPRMYMRGFSAYHFSPCDEPESKFAE